MVYCSSEAKEIMNTWGGERKPFLFVVDFEMSAIRLMELDKPLPENLAFSFSFGNRIISSNSFNKPIRVVKHPVSFETYSKAYNTVLQNIKAGNSFLVNLTFPTQIETDYTLRGLYNISKARYKLLLDNEFLVFSPETFVTIKNGVISSYPMKGTIKAADHQAREKILSDSKETAEHYTIVDLIRNDLSMVATNVKVSKLRYIDTIKTHEGELLQVSSEITGKLPNDYRKKLGNIIFKLLPAGSVTGAPKHKTLKIIEDVEIEKRGYYTGICGIFDGKDLVSAVMIRFIEYKNGKMYFRSGGGITFKSNAETEYNELIDKVYVPIG